MALYHDNFPKFSSHMVPGLDLPQEKLVQDLALKGPHFLALRIAVGWALLEFVNVVMDLLVARNSCWAHGTPSSHQTPSASENPGLGACTAPWEKDVGLFHVLPKLSGQKSVIR